MIAQMSYTVFIREILKGCVSHIKTGSVRFSKESNEYGRTREVNGNTESMPESCRETEDEVCREHGRKEKEKRNR